MDGARHVIKRILNPRFLREMASYDVASTIHQCLPRAADESGTRVGGLNPAPARQGAS